MQQAGEAARRDLREPGPQQANDLCQRHELDDERGQPGAELRRRSGGGVGPARAAGTASSGRPRCRSGARWGDLGEFFLILRGHAGHFDGPAAVGTRPRRRRRMGLVNPRRAAPCRPYRAPGRRPGRPLRPCGRSLAKGAACRRPARRAAASYFLRCSLRRFHRSRSGWRTKSRVVRTKSRAHQVTGGAHQVTDCPQSRVCAPSRRSVWRSSAGAPQCPCPANPALAGAPSNRRVRRCSTYRLMRTQPAQHFTDFLAYPVTKDARACRREA